MELFVLYVGFGTIAGIIAGYGAGRYGPGWALLALWAGVAGFAFAFAVILDMGEGPRMSTAPQFFYGTIAPFAIGSVLAGFLGVAVRLIQRQRHRHEG